MRILESLREEFGGLDRSPARLRSFGLVVGGVLVLAGLAISWRGGWAHDGVVRWLVVAGVALMSGGLIAPAALRPVYLVWMGFALILGHVMTRVLLTLVFFLIITPIGLLMRALGKDPLARSPESKLASYWIVREDGATSREQLEKYW